MATQYVLVADAARAKLLRRVDLRFEEVGAFAHPKSRLQNRELNTDGGARNQAFPGGPQSVSDPPDAHRGEAHRFSQRLAAVLRDARSHGSFDQLVLIAPPKFLGMLREELDPVTAKLVTASLPNDFTNLPQHELERTLARHLAQEGGRTEDRT